MKERIHDILARAGRFDGIRLPWLDTLRVPQVVMNVLVVGLFALSLGWFAGSYFTGLVVNNDEAYMGLSCRNYMLQPVAMLTFYLGWLSMQLFGDYLITLRMLALLCYLGAIAIPCFYFYRKTGNWRWTLFLAVAAMVVIKGIKPFFYGWDAGPILVTSWLLVLSVRYVENARRLCVAMIGFAVCVLTLMRLPAGVLALPVTLFVVSSSDRRHGISRKGLVLDISIYAGVYLFTFVVVTTFMAGSPVGYVAAFKPDNFISGHGIEDLWQGFWPMVKYDFTYMVHLYRTRLLWFGAMVAIWCLANRSRLVPGIVIIALLGWHLVDTRGSVETPFYLIAFVMLLFPICHNALKRLAGRDADCIHPDRLIVLTVLLFAMVPVLGSDRMLQRLTFFYSYPVMMVWLYPYRNGILKWLIAVTVIPAVIFGAYDRANAFRVMQWEGDRLPYHKGVKEFYSYDEYIQPLGKAVERLDSQGLRWSAFGAFRYGPMYLYGSGEPFKLNAFHYYHREQTMGWLKEYADSLDAVIIEPLDLETVSYSEVADYLNSRGFEIVDSGGRYLVFRDMKNVKL